MVLKEWNYLLFNSSALGSSQFQPYKYKHHLSFWCTESQGNKCSSLLEAASSLILSSWQGDIFTCKTSSWVPPRGDLHSGDAGGRKCAFLFSSSKVDSWAAISAWIFCHIITKEDREKIVQNGYTSYVGHEAHQKYIHPYSRSVTYMLSNLHKSW